MVDELGERFQRSRWVHTRAQGGQADAGGAREAPDRRRHEAARLLMARHDELNPGLAQAFDEVEVLLTLHGTFAFGGAVKVTGCAKGMLRRRVEQMHRRHRPASKPFPSHHDQLMPQGVWLLILTGTPKMYWTPSFSSAFTKRSLALIDSARFMLMIAQRQCCNDGSLQQASESSELFLSALHSMHIRCRSCTEESDSLRARTYS